MANFTGTPGNDNISGTNDSDRILGRSGDDILLGLGGNDFLFGDAGADLMDGGTGVDEMVGGSGDDIYRVDVEQDLVIEDPNGGIDQVISIAASTTLAQNVEKLFLVGTTSQIGRGNELDNELRGSADASSTLFGGAGNDTLFTGNFADKLSGESGNDFLSSAGGDDFLDGGAGDDTMVGGAGNDAYEVDSVGDVVQEAVNEGIDRVFSSLNHTLSANVEDLFLRGNGNLNGTGNELNNTIEGNSGKNVLKGEAGNDVLGNRRNFINNFELGLVDLGDFGDDVLDGGAGNDRMLGGVGNDLYVVDSVGDLVIEEFNRVVDPEGGGFFEGGVDTVQSSVNFTLGNFIEKLTLTGTAIEGIGNNENNEIRGNDQNNVLDGKAGNDLLFGGRGNDTMNGGFGNDTLVGDRGNDILSGSFGADRFVFDMDAPFRKAAMGKDRITDFERGRDKIVLDKTTFGDLAIADIALVTTDSAAAISSKKIVYSEETQRLFFNTNGADSGFGRNGGYFAKVQTVGIVTPGGNPSPFSISISDFAIQA
jgi:Ca2+-binding RTX toxin-like protein